MYNKAIACATVSAALLYGCRQHTADWPVYGGSRAADHYSALTQVDTDNVASLQPAWEYHCGDSAAGTQIQANPLVINGVLYGISPRLKLFALEAGSGKPLWTFDPVDPSTVKGKGYFSMNVCRGLTCYGKGEDARLFYGAGSSLYCINAANGKPVAGFGNGGKIDLHEGLGSNVKDLYVASTTPGIVYKDLLIVGTRVSEDAGAAPGHIRAFDVHTGQLRWVFHTIPQPGEPGYDSWKDPQAWQHTGGANAWAGFSLDEDKGILFAPVGSASYDFYGGKRPGDNLYANCVLALDAATGKRIWHFQTVHHDIWDRDLPTAPVLVSVTKDEKKRDAVVQVTKSGFIFLLDRSTGQPLYPVAETPVPAQSDLSGEQPSRTQPVPSFFKPFVRQVLTENDLNKLLPDSSYREIRERWAASVHDHLFAPPSITGTVIFPGFDGGAEWGGPSYDPATGILYVNASEMPWILTMVPIGQTKAVKETNLEAGKRLYTTTCMSCHGSSRQGSGNNPPLINAGVKYDELSFTTLLNTGRRMMPAFKQLTQQEKTALASFILGLKNRQALPFAAPASVDDPYVHMPFTSTGYNKFRSREGYPAVDTPWGTLTAINLNTGVVEWKQTLGDVAELKKKGIHSGTENYGGSVVTAGGVLFIAATSDSMIRAFHKRTGALLWEHSLPAPGFATPSVYEVNGKQYIVIACGGGKLGKPSGDSYIAFSLAQK